MAPHQRRRGRRSGPAARAGQIAPDDTALTLNARCWEAALSNLPQLIDMLERGDDQGSAQPTRR
ncbi:hypothetical protein FLP41_02790 (plasmid) [Paracoccus marcusii]|uniref:hypothetical protein n=1 Tax=Paracoccus marcusii TaxID=59779 RepID=UPI002ED50721|nr:hypothetical protein FLP41_02790 [Paracoccus marcusii]